MRIDSRKKLMFSCIFLILIMFIFGKNIKILNQVSSMKVAASPVVKMSNNHSSSKKYCIVLDPGHGGIDRGTSYGNMNEKDLTLKIAKYAESYLKSQGDVVFLTRDKDKLVPLKEIGNKTNSYHADVFVSIHVNSLNDKNFNGITALYYDVNGYQKSERIRLAKTIESQAVKNDGWESRGIRRQNLAVLRYSKIPGVLMECGFITNDEDRKRLSNDDVLKRLAKNISDGIIKYLNENPQ